MGRTCRRIPDTAEVAPGDSVDPLKGDLLQEIRSASSPDLANNLSIDDDDDREDTGESSVNIESDSKETDANDRVVSAVDLDSDENTTDICLCMHNADLLH